MPLQNTSPAESKAPHGLASLEAALASSDVGKRRVISVVVLCVESLPELRSLFGSELYQAAMNEIQIALTKTIRGRGIGARTGPTEFTLVFPEFYKREADALLAACLGTPPHFEFMLGETEVVLAPEVAVDSLGKNESIREAHARLRKQLSSSMANERERIEAMTRRTERFVARSAHAAA